MMAHMVTFAVNLIRIWTQHVQ